MRTVTMLLAFALFALAGCSAPGTPGSTAPASGDVEGGYAPQGTPTDEDVPTDANETSEAHVST